MSENERAFVWRQPGAPGPCNQSLRQMGAAGSGHDRGQSSTVWTLAAALCIAATAAGARTVYSADEPASGLREGWKWRTTIPPVKYKDNIVTRESRVMMWVEKGWLLVSRSTIDDDLEWHVVLARAGDAAKPRIKVDKPTGALEVRYREYFIREGIGGRLRIYRELKTDESPEWPALSLDGERHSLGGGASRITSIDSFAMNQWCWIACGPSAKHPDLWVRLQPTTARSGAASRGNALSGFYGTANGPAEMFYGDSQVQEEGDLFIGNRTNVDDAERGLDDFTLNGALRDKVAPELAASHWLHEADPLSLGTLEKRVVLLYFWADWCKPSVRELSRVEQISKKFGKRDLVVIGIHSAERSESAGQFVQDSKVSFPVMIDDGQTAKRYWVGALPNCFLIDKSGKVVWGFAMAPPTDAQIEELLK